MAWEQRQRGGSYYTRSKRVNGGVVREYVGGGVIGRLAAAEDAIRRAERLASVEAVRSARARVEALDARCDRMHAAVEALAHDRLRAAGYHRPHRGEWRRRRG